MKLYALNSQLAMSNAHDLITTTICMLRPGSHFKTVGQISFSKNQGMIAGGIERCLQIGKNPLLAMMDSGHLAMHDLPGAQHRSTKSNTDTLMTKADPQQG